MLLNQRNIVDGTRDRRRPARFSPSRFEGNRREKEEVIKLKNRSMSCPPPRGQKDEESDEELTSEVNIRMKTRDNRPSRKPYTPSPPRPSKEDKKIGIFGSKHPPPLNPDHRTQSTNVDGSGPGTSGTAPLRPLSQQTPQPSTSKRSTKPNRRYEDYFLFPITTNRIPTNLPPAPPPQKKLKFNDKPMMSLKDVKKEPIDPDETNTSPAPIQKKGRGRPKKECSADSQDSTRKRGRPKKNHAAPVQPPRRRGRPLRRSTASLVAGAVKNDTSRTDHLTPRQVDSDDDSDPEESEAQESEQVSDSDSQDKTEVVEPPKKRGRPARRSTASSVQSTRRRSRSTRLVDGGEEEAAPTSDPGTDSSSDSDSDAEKEPASDSQEQMTLRNRKKPVMTLKEIKKEVIDEEETFQSDSPNTHQTTRRSLRLNRQFVEVKKEPTDAAVPVSGNGADVSPYESEHDSNDDDAVEDAERVANYDLQENMEIYEPPTTRVRTRSSDGRLVVEDTMEMDTRSRETRLRSNRQQKEVKQEPIEDGYGLDYAAEREPVNDSQNNFEVEEPPMTRGRSRTAASRLVANPVEEKRAAVSDPEEHHVDSDHEEEEESENAEEESDSDSHEHIAQEPPTTKMRARRSVGRLEANDMMEMEIEPRQTRHSLRLNGRGVEVKQEPIDPDAEQEPAHNAHDDTLFEEPKTRPYRRSNGRGVEVKVEPNSDDDEEPEPVHTTRSQRRSAAPPRSNDLNADGTGPGCSNAPYVPPRKSRRVQDRNADGSAPGPSSAPFVAPKKSRRVQDRNADGSAPGPSNAPVSIEEQGVKLTPDAALSATSSEDEEEDEEDKCMKSVRVELQCREGLRKFKCRGCEGCSLPEEDENMPLIDDAPNFQIPPEAERIFEAAKKQANQQSSISPQDLAEVYRVVEFDYEAHLPRKIHFSKFLMKTTYGSPFPPEYRRAETLYICEFCMFYAREDRVMKLHAKSCQWRAPPGIEIYRKDNISIFEVDGNKQKRYCESLCLLSRCFLDSKTMFWDTGLWLFYIITQNDEVGCHFAGYFSKEKDRESEKNVNCIVALPCYQANGYGRFLIDVSYCLSRRQENWNTGPELPFSDLGERAYLSYWRMAIAKALANFKKDIEDGDGICIMDITHATGINPNDVLKTLADLEWIKLKGAGTKKNKNVRNISWDVDWKTVEDILQQVRTSPRAQFDEDYLDWKPTDWTPELDGFWSGG